MIRQLQPGDARALLRHLFRLSRDDRRRRFGASVPDAFVTAYVRRIDWQRTVIVAWVEGSHVRGAAALAWPRVRWLDGGADIAVEVEPDWRRQGIADALLREAVAAARQHKVPAISFSTLADNQPIKRLAQRYGARMTRLGAEIEGRIRLGSRVPPGAPRPDCS